jgi:hypothetical protein
MDGTLSPAAFLDFTNQLLFLSSSARGMAVRGPRMMSIVKARIQGVSNSVRNNDTDEDKDNHSEVYAFTQLLAIVFTI